MRKPAADEVSFGKLNVNAYKFHVPLRTSVVRADYAMEQELKMRGGPAKATSNSELF